MYRQQNLHIPRLVFSVSEITPFRHLLENVLNLITPESSFFYVVFFFSFFFIIISSFHRQSVFCRDSGTPLFLCFCRPDRRRFFFVALQFEIPIWMTFGVGSRFEISRRMIVRCSATTDRGSAICWENKHLKRGSLNLLIVYFWLTFFFFFCCFV